MVKSRLSVTAIRNFNIIRAIAAVYVILHHVAQSHFDMSVKALFIFKFGQEAVIIFFVTSGALIFLNESECDQNIKIYYEKRIIRLYPVLIAAMLCSAIVELDNGTFQKNFSLSSMLGTLIGLQDTVELKPGVIIGPFLENGPLWSLSYEIFFYLIFPFVLRFWKNHKSAANFVIPFVCCAAYLSYAVFPNHWSIVSAYFLIWWSGAMMTTFLFDNRQLRQNFDAAVTGLLVISVISGVVVIVAGFQGFERYPFLPFRHFIVGYIILRMATEDYIIKIARKIRLDSEIIGYVASISYGLYVFHYPLLIVSRQASSISGFIIMTATLISVSQVFDRMLTMQLKDFMRRVSNRQK